MSRTNCDSSCACKSVRHDDEKQLTYFCECGHDSCSSPAFNDLDFENRAVEYYRYCLEMEADGYQFSTFSPNEYLENKDEYDCFACEQKGQDHA